MKAAVFFLSLSFFAFPTFGSQELSETEFKELAKAIQYVTIPDFQEKGLTLLPIELFHMRDVADFFRRWEEASVFPYGKNQKEFIKNEGIYSISFKGSSADQNGRPVPNTKYADYVIEFNKDGEVVKKTRYDVNYRGGVMGIIPYEINFDKTLDGRKITTYSSQKLRRELSLIKRDKTTYELKDVTGNGLYVSTWVFNKEARLISMSKSKKNNPIVEYGLTLERDSETQLVANINEVKVKDPKRGRYSISYQVEWSTDHIRHPLKALRVSCRGSSQDCRKGNERNFYFEYEEKILKQKRLDNNIRGGIAAADVSSYKINEKGQIEEYLLGKAHKLYYLVNELDLDGVDLSQDGQRYPYFRIIWQDENLGGLEIDRKYGILRRGKYQFMYLRNGDISRIVLDGTVRKLDFKPTHVLEPVLPHQYFDY